VRFLLFGTATAGAFSPFGGMNMSHSMIKAVDAADAQRCGVSIETYKKWEQCVRFRCEVWDTV
jgi:hypothetical protein